MINKHFSVDCRAIAKALETAASTYEEGAEIPNAIADRLLERLDFIRLEPLRVVDLGSRTGYSIKGLFKRYKQADIFGFDFSVSLMNRAAHAFQLHSKMVVGEYTRLPFVDQSISLVFSNLTFQWSFDLYQTLEECQRILKPGGFLLFSTVGPDTLKELRASFSDEKCHVHSFYDMHDIGDMLSYLGFVDPVMDMEYLSVHYSSVLNLMADLKAIGAHNVAQDRSRGLMGRNRWGKMLQTYEKCRDKNRGIPATIEVIYGHAFKSEVSSSNQKEVLVPLEHVKGKINTYR